MHGLVGVDRIMTAVRCGSTLTSSAWLGLVGLPLMTITLAK